MKKSPFNLTHQHSSTESKIVVALERISEAFRVLLWNECKENSLSPIQIQTLIFLLFHSDEKCKVSYLANEFNLTKATISDAIKSLEQKKFIKKEYETIDNRSYIIQLTKKGKEIAEQTSHFAKQIQIPIDKLHSTDKENLLLSLLDIIYHLNKSGIITIQRMCFTCHFYKSNKTGQEHYCGLLNTKLADTELRIDCAEHKQKQTV